MAARKNLKHDAKTRDKIQASQLINRLTNYALGNDDPSSKKPIEMSSQQVSAALGLLKKSIPDLSAVEMNANVEQVNYAVDSSPLSVEEWKKEQRSSGDPSQGHNTH